MTLSYDYTLTAGTSQFDDGAGGTNTWAQLTSAAAWNTITFASGFSQNSNSNAIDLDSSIGATTGWFVHDKDVSATANVALNVAVLNAAAPVGNTSLNNAITSQSTAPKRFAITYYAQTLASSQVPSSSLKVVAEGTSNQGAAFALTTGLTSNFLADTKYSDASNADSRVYQFTDTITASSQFNVAFEAHRTTGTSSGIVEPTLAFALSVPKLLVAKHVDPAKAAFLLADNEYTSTSLKATFYDSNGDMVPIFQETAVAYVKYFYTAAGGVIEVRQAHVTGTVDNSDRTKVSFDLTGIWNGTLMAKEVTVEKIAFTPYTSPASISTVYSVTTPYVGASGVPVGTPLGPYGRRRFRWTVWSILAFTLVVLVIIMAAVMVYRVANGKSTF